MGLEPLLWPHLTFVTSLQSLSPNTVLLGVRALMYEFWGEHKYSFHNGIWEEEEDFGILKKWEREFLANI